jgi:hypothetical protein
MSVGYGSEESLDLARAAAAARRQLAAGPMPDALATPARRLLWEGAPPTYRPLLLEAWSGTLGPRAAIRVKCLECVGWVRAEIPACTADGCPLWAYRPGQSLGDFAQETPEGDAIGADPMSGPGGAP